MLVLSNIFLFWYLSFRYSVYFCFLLWVLLALPVHRIGLSLTIVLCFSATNLKYSSENSLDLQSCACFFSILSASAHLYLILPDLLLILWSFLGSFPAFLFPLLGAEIIHRLNGTSRYDFGFIYFGIFDLSSKPFFCFFYFFGFVFCSLTFIF